MESLRSWEVGGKQIFSRLWLGTARYPSLDVMRSSIIRSKTEVVTVSLRRESSSRNSGDSFWRFIKDLNVNFLPNTAGCFSVREAITTAEMARDFFQTDWIKLELIGDFKTLCPEVFALVEAAKDLVKRGFQVFPYTTDDLIVCQKLIDIGCCALMPWGSPIGTGRGISNRHQLIQLRQSFPNIPIIVDAGIGRPSHAVTAMEIGCDAVLLNTAVAIASDPVVMAEAFSSGVEAGRLGYLAGIMAERDDPVCSTPLDGRPFQKNF